MGNETKPPAAFLNTSDSAFGNSLCLILKFFGVPGFGAGLGTTIGIAIVFHRSLRLTIVKKEDVVEYSVVPNKHGASERFEKCDESCALSPHCNGKNFKPSPPQCTPYGQSLGQDIAILRHDRSIHGLVAGRFEVLRFQQFQDYNEK